MFIPFLKKKIRYAFGHNIHDSILEMTLKETIHHFQDGNDTENSQENISTEDHISDCRLKPAR